MIIAILKSSIELS